MLLTDADQLRRLELERWNWEQSARHRERERDEARAEVEKLGKALTLETRLSLSTQRKLDEARAEVERLKADNSVMGNYWSFAAALRDVAERQREACARAVEDADDGVPLQCLADAIREKPLVMEVEP